MSEQGLERPSRRRQMRRLWYLLLLVELAGLCYPGWYAHVGPKAGPWPFFYWYQFAWVIGGAVINAVVYLLTREPR